MQIASWCSGTEWYCVVTQQMSYSAYSVKNVPKIYCLNLHFLILNVPVIPLLVE